MDDEELNVIQPKNDHVLMSDVLKDVLPQDEEGYVVAERPTIVAVVLERVINHSSIVPLGGVLVDIIHNNDTLELVVKCAIADALDTFRAHMSNEMIISVDNVELQVPDEPPLRCEGGRLEGCGLSNIDYARNICELSVKLVPSQDK